MIHQVASQLVSAAVRNTSVNADTLLGDLASRRVAGVYVTLKRGDTLRGCCGVQGQPMPLGQALAHSAQRTAKEDPRMAPIAEAELPYLDLTVSLLGEPRPIGVKGDERIDAVQVGKHGLRIRMGHHAGLLLPSVARERGWTSRQFLDAVCRKAGLPPGAWRSDQATVELFDGIDFGGPLAVDTALDQQEASVVDETDLSQLVQWIRYNLDAIQTGATPSYYAMNVVDIEVLGVVLQIKCHNENLPHSWLQLVFRDGMPLQSKLFEFTQTAAKSLAGYGPAGDWDVRVAVLSSAIHHGLDSDADLRGMDCQRRAIVVRDAKRVALAYDRRADSQQLLEQALRQQPFRSGNTEVYSVVCDASVGELTVSIGPQAQSQITTRPPAVAGTFYPAKDVEREQIVDECFKGLPEIEKQTVAAAMVPHAGLRFSGRIAADVWRRIELPETVLIIGPKHTRDGVDWAVAPHDFFQISPTAGLPGDAVLAQQLANAVPGMQLDAAAHRREHGSEVQFPILYRLNAKTKVVSVAMQGGSIDELAEAARALANWLRGLEKPPLLVISSDMNHFAEEDETRRRDKLALDMLRANDPAGLLSICAEEDISMCGQIPAALVLLTLKELGKQVDYQQIAYGTSADVSGDRSRVVGYAGVRF
ncbi:hypothetical protein Q31b_49170 [Novipirellula aureliae]|uniref:AMMECR1 domain-containing protein n=2 Tax=Novipirellula aureliae TaxID=2527966 RepID=A0A5C6DNV0_9BACT|nr:hypothetical protein Q31b_49170 [Novipirellula aureliae]